MIFITICATLLTITAGLHLLAKARKEGLGKLFTWAAYLILIVASLLLICELTRAFGRMCGHKGNHRSECCAMGMHEGRSHHGDKACCNHGNKAMMNDDEEDDDEHEGHEEHAAADSTGH